jgi:hypothetical protein
VHDRRADHRHLEEVLLGLLDALLDRRLDLLGLAVPDADHALAVADDDERGELEPTTALHDLGDAVDRDDALVELLALLFAATPATVVAAAAPTARAASTVVRCHVRDLPQNSSPVLRAPSASAATRPA